MGVLPEGRSSVRARAVLCSRPGPRGCRRPAFVARSMGLQKVKSHVRCMLVAPGDFCIDLFLNSA